MITNNVFHEQKVYICASADAFEIRNKQGQAMVIPTIPTTSGTIPYTLWLFDSNFKGSHNSAISYCRAKLYSFKIWDGDQLVMNLLPAHDGSDVVCLRDAVSGNYFYNQGTGAFSFGTDA